MATFRVGQRVRVVSRHPSSRAPVGLEGRIVAIHDFRGNVTGSPYPYSVKFGIHEHDNLHDWHYAAHQLEPVNDQPERNRVVAWSECLWQPPHMREVA